MRWLLPFLFPSFLGGCDRGFVDPARELAPPVPDGPLHPVEVVAPPALGEVDTPLVDATGASIGVGCGTCHAPGSRLEPGAEPFHAGVVVRHGELACAACHDPDDRSRLRFADGQPLPFAEARALCAQCHGPQHRDWLHGSHGGMAGHWDRRQGPRVRNHCLSCHPAHAPAWGSYLPVLPPRDRYFHGATGHESEAH